MTFPAGGAPTQTTRMQGTEASVRRSSRISLEQQQQQRSNRISVSPLSHSNLLWINPDDDDDIRSSRRRRSSRLVRCAQCVLIPVLVLFLSALFTQPHPFDGPFQPQELDATLPLTLRQVLTDETMGFHLAMAPAFFGFYGYLGLLSAFPVHSNEWPLRSVVGASAGAMVAMVIACEIPPSVAMTFLSQVTVSQYADGPGWGAVFRGNRVETLLHQFLLQHTTVNTSVVTHMEQARRAVAVTAFDLATLSTRIVRSGPMARAARASATFPGLFQPVALDDSAVLVDGGLQDVSGTLALTEILTSKNEGPTRVLQLCIGRCRRPPASLWTATGVEWISISILGLPLVGPWNQETQGPRAYEMARQAMRAALDVPLRASVAGGKRRHHGVRHSLTLRA